MQGGASLAVWLAQPWQPRCAAAHARCTSCLRVQLESFDAISPPSSLQAKLAKLRRELMDPAGGSAAGGGKGEGFDVNKVGDARVGLVGFPSVGKSTLLNKLTGTFSEVRFWGRGRGGCWRNGGSVQCPPGPGVGMHENGRKRSG